MNEDVNDPVIDPDNPPMTGQEVWVSARELFLKKYAETKARIDAAPRDRQAPSAVTPALNRELKSFTRSDPGCYENAAPEHLCDPVCHRRHGVDGSVWIACDRRTARSWDRMSDARADTEITSD